VQILFTLFAIKQYLYCCVAFFFGRTPLEIFSLDKFGRRRTLDTVGRPGPPTTSHTSGHLPNNVMANSLEANSSNTERKAHFYGRSKARVGWDSMNLCFTISSLFTVNGGNVCHHYTRTVLTKSLLDLPRLQITRGRSPPSSPSPQKKQVQKKFSKLLICPPRPSSHLPRGLSPGSVHKPPDGRKIPTPHTKKYRQENGGNARRLLQKRGECVAAPNGCGYGTQR